MRYQNSQMELFNSQLAAKAHLSSWKVGALFMKPGTGKTRVACELVNASSCSSIVYIAPIRTIHPQGTMPSIIDEVNKWGGFKMPATYVGVESIQQSDRIYMETCSMLQQANNPFIIVDESLKIKNVDAKRTKRIINLGQLAEHKLILNGTPLSKNLLDLYPQMQFLSPKILGMGIAEFKNTFCNYTTITKYQGRYRRRIIGQKEFITGYENIDYLYSLIRHYVFECDLNLRIDKYYNELQYALCDEARSEYEELKKRYLNDGTLMWKNNNIFLEMTQKMQHTYCCTEDKFKQLDELFKKIDQSRSIIFCKYIASREACMKRYPKATTLSYQKEALSLNLQHYHNTIYFDKTWDYATRDQSSFRTYRTGQEYDCYYWDLTGDVGLENLIDSNIIKKISMIEYFKTISKKQLKEIL